MASQVVMQWVGAAMAHANYMPQAELARKLSQRMRRSYDRSMVYKILKGTRDVSAQEMLMIEEITGFPAPAEALTKIVSVPLLSWISAGKLANVESQVPASDARQLSFADLGPGDFFALEVQGDSMNLLSPHGSVIVVNRADRELVPDRPYVFSRRGEATYKLWQPDPPHLAPYSNNPANKPIFVKGKRDLQVVGRVRRTVLDL